MYAILVMGVASTPAVGVTAPSRSETTPSGLGGISARSAESPGSPNYSVDHTILPGGIGIAGETTPPQRP